MQDLDFSDIRLAIRLRAFTDRIEPVLSEAHLNDLRAAERIVDKTVKDKTLALTCKKFSIDEFLRSLRIPYVLQETERSVELYVPEAYVEAVLAVLKLNVSAVIEVKVSSLG